MPTYKITLHEVVNTTNTIEVEYPFYLKSNQGDFFIIVDEHNAYKVIPLINCIMRTIETAELILKHGGTMSTKYEFNEALRTADANFTHVYEAIEKAQADAITDYAKQAQDAQDARIQNLLENFLDK